MIQRPTTSKSHILILEIHFPERIVHSNLPLFSPKAQNQWKQNNNKTKTWNIFVSLVLFWFLPKTWVLKMCYCWMVFPLFLLLRALQSLEGSTHHFAHIVSHDINYNFVHRLFVGVGSHYRTKWIVSLVSHPKKARRNPASEGITVTNLCLVNPFSQKHLVRLVLLFFSFKLLDYIRFHNLYGS